MEARETGRVGDIEGAEYEYVTLALFETPLRQSGDRQSSGRSVRGCSRDLPAIPLVDHHLTPDRADCLSGHDAGEGRPRRTCGVEADTAGGRRTTGDGSGARGGCLLMGWDRLGCLCGTGGDSSVYAASTC